MIRNDKQPNRGKRKDPTRLPSHTRLLPSLCFDVGRDELEGLIDDESKK